MDSELSAEKLTYFGTSRTSPDDWMDKAQAILERLNGDREHKTVLARGGGQDASGRAAYMIVWQIGGDTYRVNWPVLPSKKGNLVAARVQAATMLSHHVKDSAVAAVMGVSSAFLAHLVLPDGRTAGNADGTDLAEVKEKP